MTSPTVYSEATIGPVRTRIAPSPTGDPHVGTGYVALFNYCFAKQHGGQFILRIEDTDQQRSTGTSEQKIFESLHWLGLDWDEGPDLGGPRGPYRQSERRALYQQHAAQLLERDEAFHCFCTSERLAELRKLQMASGTGQLGYDGCCLGLSQEEISSRLNARKSHVIRLRVPREGSCHIDDLLRAPIEIQWDQVDMQVLIKSDGMPTYHLANVVDDHLMEITHVIRGEEWITSAPKHLRLYEAFGWTPPKLCHLPLLRNTDKSKLSKRKNPTSITYYERIGYLPEALLNYLGRMAWSMPDEEEKFTLAQMVEHFDLSRISLGGPIFDITKLDWLNGRWIREELDDETLVDRLEAWRFNRDFLLSVLPLVRQRLDKLSDLGQFSSFFIGGSVHPTPEHFTHKKLTQDQIRQILTWGSWRLEELSEWSSAEIQMALRTLATESGFKLREFLAPFYPALTGRQSATPLFETATVLGRDICRFRIREALTVLGGLSKKEEKRWRKAYDQRRNEETQGETTLE